MPVALASLTSGRVLCVHVAGDGPESLRLKRLGVCQDRLLEIVHGGDPMILRVAGTRVGISRQLAQMVTVRLPEFAEEASSPRGQNDEGSPQ